MSNFWFQPDATTNLRVIDLGDLAHEDVQQVINFVYTGSFRFRIKIFKNIRKFEISWKRIEWDRSISISLFSHISSILTKYGTSLEIMIYREIFMVFRRQKFKFSLKNLF